MARKRPVPDDFAANAQRKNAELEVLYGVSEATVKKWRRATGLRGTKGRGPQKARPSGLDSDAEIKVCLNCQALDCSHGDCARRKAAAL